MDEAVEKGEEHTGPNGEMTSKEMYYHGKDIGIAEAKVVISERLGE